ncbi:MULTISPECIES: ABC transporter substrate-binding protein [Paenibacillus]|uniref:ABC transporter substrate-binding protein n=1 Tax=Paenibacillus alvei TaxID=44250 RepID=A0ABT4EGL2_PAEAL|nr:MULTISPECIES: ABC transporter substrate-binding protein [Paenibacillus]EPY13271.1 ABC transporter substrate-binding protein [Paenibacillus alvei A6-6i-x]MCY9532886.1 ABC transporter substrate-binding protein [Paenibacillus alvei]SDE74026.1 NitT/TauT family transport system substrate-binding protein [Paenibacillus sp. cl6col]
MRHKWRIGTLAIVVFAVLVLSGCGSSSDLVKIKVGEVTRSVFYAPEYVALGKGFFKEEGLDVDLQTTSGGDKTMTALLSGGIDVALVGSETSIYVAQQGAEDPVINFAQLTQTDGTFLVAREKKDGFDWDQLKGSTFLGQRKGGMPQMAGEFTLKKHGIDPHKDLQLIQNIDFANIASAFASGTGEYVQLFEPQASIFEKEGKGVVVASFGVESGKLPYTAFMSKQSYISKNKDAVQKFTNAIYKAQQWAEKQSAEEITDVILPFFKDADRDIVASAVKRYKEQQSYAADPVLDEQEWNNLLDVLDSAGELKSRVHHEQIVTNEFAEKAIKLVK